MQRFSSNTQDDHEDILYMPHPSGGMVDFDTNDPFERMLLRTMNSRPYRRMVNIPQLGFSNYDYPCAHHTRFDHCIGAMDLARDMIYFSKRNQGLTRKEALSFSLEEQACQAADAHHDIGQTFPGHAFENALKKLFPETFKTHEEWGIEILKNSEIYGILNSYKEGFADMVIKIMKEDDLDNNLYQQIHCGALNTDTMDYIRRDRQHVIGSDFDLIHPIVENISFIKVDGKPRICISESGAEIFALLLEERARMYTDIYYNGISKACDIHILPLLQEINSSLESKKFRKLAERINSPYINFIASKGTDYNSYLELTANNFRNTMKSLGREGDKKLSRLTEAFIHPHLNFWNINLYKGVYERAPYDYKIEEAKEIISEGGGLFNDITIPLYKADKPEVYIRNGKCLTKFSHLYPNIADKKMRTISGFFLYSPDMKKSLKNKKNITEKIQSLRKERD